MNVATRLKDMREAAGLTQDTLAERIGVTQSSIGDMEQGKKRPTFDMLLDICHALRITLSEFYDDENPEPWDDDQVKLPPEAEKEIEELVEYLRRKYGRREKV